MNESHYTMPEMLHFDLDEIRRYLDEKSAPCSEAELLRALTRDELPGMSQDLFVMHFSLYHALYLVREAVGGEGLYLHLDPMRIRLLPVPEDGICRHYNPDAGAYCGDRADDSGYCAGHRLLHPEGLSGLSYDCVREFYLNPGNIQFGRSDLLKRLLNGVFVYAFKRGEIERALGVFGLYRPSKSQVRRRYRELAKRYHPDLHTEGESRMKELNSAYGVLSEVFIL
ncbi:MAG: hypothetical protein EPN93_16970 [Spirochaetes bacterium]|nr:MAG: hypothetical protein EPN93_16970 [Spirochaetota bacterium]